VALHGRLFKREQEAPETGHRGLIGRNRMNTNEFCL
jgi:hypothetical protein